MAIIVLEGGRFLKDLRFLSETHLMVFVRSDINLTAVLGALFLSAVFFACGKNAAVVVPGATSAQQLERMMGPAERVSGVSSVVGAQVHHYGSTKYQIEDQRVTATLRDPIGREKVLQYWRYRWIGKKQSERRIQGEGHGAERIHLQATELGIGVIYDVQLGEVIRVVEYVP